MPIRTFTQYAIQCSGKHARFEDFLGNGIKHECLKSLIEIAEAMGWTSSPLDDWWCPECSKERKGKT